MLTVSEIREVVQDTVALLPAVQGVVLASPLRAEHIELLLVLATAGASRRVVIDVSRADRRALTRSLDEGLRPLHPDDAET